MGKRRKATGSHRPRRGWVLGLRAVPGPCAARRALRRALWASVWSPCSPASPGRGEGTWGRSTGRPLTTLPGAARVCLSPFASIWGHVQVGEDVRHTPQGTTFREPISVMIKAMVTASVLERLCARER